jgi:hypothetical protein
MLLSKRYTEDLMDSPLDSFDFNALEDKEFKEDAVREEIIAPLVRALGYRPTGSNKVVRSRSLEHPFVSIGSVKKRIKIYPDYLLLVNDLPCLALEAKAPGEAVDDPDHVSQAYSYAIHREVKAQWFGICNGYELALYNVDDVSSVPRKRWTLNRLEESWEDLVSHLVPSVISNHHRKMAKDFGLHLKMLDVSTECLLIMMGIPLVTIGRADDDTYSIVANTVLSEGSEYCASFDFSSDIKDQIFEYMPEWMATSLNKKLEKAPAIVRFETDKHLKLVIHCHRTDQILENKEEYYSPLRVVRLEPLFE